MCHEISEHDAEISTWYVDPEELDFVNFISKNSQGMLRMIGILPWISLIDSSIHSTDCRIPSKNHTNILSGKYPQTFPNRINEIRLGILQKFLKEFLR